MLSFQYYYSDDGFQHKGEDRLYMRLRLLQDGPDHLLHPTTSCPAVPAVSDPSRLVAVPKPPTNGHHIPDAAASPSNYSEALQLRVTNVESLADGGGQATGPAKPAPLPMQRPQSLNKRFVVPTSMPSSGVASAKVVYTTNQRMASPNAATNRHPSTMPPPASRPVPILPGPARSSLVRMNGGSNALGMPRPVPMRRASIAEERPRPQEGARNVHTVTRVLTRGGDCYVIRKMPEKPGQTRPEPQPEVPVKTVRSPVAAQGLLSPPPAQAPLPQIIQTARMTTPRPVTVPAMYQLQGNRGVVRILPGGGKPSMEEPPAKVQVMDKEEQEQEQEVPADPLDLINILEDAADLKKVEKADEDQKDNDKDEGGGGDDNSDTEDESEVDLGQQEEDQEEADKDGDENGDVDSESAGGTGLIKDPSILAVSGELPSRAVLANEFEEEGHRMFIINARRLKPNFDTSLGSCVELNKNIVSIIIFYTGCASFWLP